MNDQTIILVAPDFPPKRGGVSDYSQKFYQYLRQQQSVELITSESYPGWKGISLMKFMWRLSQSSADTVLFQYTPYLYGKSWCNIQFPFFLFIYSLFKRKKIQLMVHELNYPFLGDLKSLIVHLAHRLMGRLLCASADVIFASTELLREEVGTISFGRTVHLPIGSNIEKSSKFTGILEKLKLEKDQFLCIFGGFHSSKCLDVVIDSIREINFPVVHIGATEEDYRKNNIPLTSNLITAGYLSEEEVSELLGHARGSLIYYIDGASTRRGSLMAAIEHGTPTVTNSTWKTDEILFDCPVLKIARREKEFRELVYEMSQNPRGEYSFENPFTWEKIVNKYLTL